MSYITKTYFEPPEIVLLTQATKNAIVSRKFIDEHRMSVCSLEIFVPNFLTF